MSTPLEYGERDNLGYTRHCNNCKKYAPESWSSGLCHACYRDLSDRLEQQRRDDEQARWDALKARAAVAEARVADLGARIKRLVVMHEPERYEHEGGEVATYCRECSTFTRRAFVRWPCRTARALVGDETPGTGGGA